jgi:prevent-host-death family protein
MYTYTTKWGVYMKSVSATRLRKDLFRVLEQIQHGETVEITRNGRPVARLSAVAPVDWRDRMSAVPEIVGDDHTAFAPLDDVWNELDNAAQFAMLHVASVSFPEQEERLRSPLTAGPVQP